MSIDRFWEGLTKGLEEQDYRSHPPEEVLRAYVAGEFGADTRSLQFDLESFLRERKQWSRTAISLHVASCPRCAAQVAKLRGLSTERKGSRISIIAWESEREVARYLPWAWAAAGLTAIVLNFLLNLPSHTDYFIAGGKIM